MAHHNTILGQMLKMFPRHEFQKAVESAGTEYHSRGFTSWNHFVAMLFGQLAGQDSLRGICAGLATQSEKLYHLGVQPVARSTLAYANEHRSHKLFENVFSGMLSKCQAIAPGHNFRFKNPLYSIDATICELCLSLYDWATFHHTKGAIKLHVKLNHAGYLPTFMVMTTGEVNEQCIAPCFPVEHGDVVVFDRGYNNFAWYKSIDDKAAFFVTRQRSNANYAITERRDTSRFENISCDQTIAIKGTLSKQKYPKQLRRIRSKDPQTGKSIVLLTNNFAWSANTIARIYKERWQIELFFKTIKQQLKVKSFVGTSQNALLSQLWVALITYLLLAYLKFRSQFNWSLYMLSSILPTNLFSKRNLWDWLSAPFHGRSHKPVNQHQLELFAFS